MKSSHIQPEVQKLESMNSADSSSM